MGEMSVDDTDLTGSGSPSMTVEQLQEGRSEFAHWPAIIDGAEATVFVPSVECDSIPVRSNYQLVWRPVIAESGINLLTNTDAEDDQGAVTTVNQGTGGGVWSTDEARPGVQSFKFVSLGGSSTFAYLPPDQSLPQAGSSTSLYVNPGETYKASVWVYHDSANSSATGALYWRMLLIDSEDELALLPVVDQVLLMSDLPTDEWVYLSHLATIPEPDVYRDTFELMQTYLQTSSTTEDGTVLYLDDWSLERVELAKGGLPVTHGRVSRRGSRR